MDDVREAARAHFAAIFGSLIGQALPEHRDLMTSSAIAFAEDAAKPTVGFYRSLEIESEVYAKVADVLEQHDLLIAPVFGVPALTATVADYDIEVMYRHGMTLIFNMCSRCPVLVVPCGRSRAGVPLGIQIVGRTYDDVSVFRAAAAFAAARPWFRRGRPPALERSSNEHLRSPPAAGAPRGRHGRRRGRLVRSAVSGAARAAARRPRARSAPLTLRVGWTSEPDNLNPFIGWQNSRTRSGRSTTASCSGSARTTADPRPGARVPHQGERGHLRRRQGVDDRAAHGVKWSDGQPIRRTTWRSRTTTSSRTG